VLANLNLDQRDTIFILVFGESLLNDGIAITVFQTLVNRFDGKTTDHTTSIDEILDACATFMISMFGSIVIGLACGCGAWAYFNMLGDLLPPVMEVGSFFLWALIPYYISDGVGWSGIVSIVAVGFFMDIYIAGPKSVAADLDMKASMSVSPNQLAALAAAPLSSGYRGMTDDDIAARQVIHSVDSMQTSRSIGPLPSTERINMSAIADRHVRFVAHLTSHLAENAIFAYIGLFLFSNQYDWNATLIAIAITSCVFSRVLMVIVVSWLIYHIYKCRGVPSFGSNSSRTATAIQNPRTQAVLVLAGLRGAVSLALVENIPIKNNVTGQGCEYKQVMKGMTSACIVFTTFVFGGGAYYILPHLGIKQDGGGSATGSNGGRIKEGKTAAGNKDMYSPPISPMPTIPCDSTTGNNINTFTRSINRNLCTAAKRCLDSNDHNDNDDDSSNYHKDPSITMPTIRQQQMRAATLNSNDNIAKVEISDPNTIDRTHPII
jgi:NhaP-type Na+/H+ or K+/H+ antiporter